MFIQRAVLAATLSANWGIYGPAFELCEGRAAKPAPGKTGSEEYLDSEKYQLRQWNRDDPNSIAPLITRLNRIRRANPALQRNERLVFHDAPNPQILCYSKSTPDHANTILVVVNLDPKNEQTALLDLKLDQLGVPWEGSFSVTDLLTGMSYHWKDQWNFVALRPWEMPAHVFRIVR
jgi:starch synthase (maltosyl-transferring)